MTTRSLASCVVLAMFVVGAAACAPPNAPGNDQTTVTVSPPSGSTPPAGPAVPAAPPAAK